MSELPPPIGPLQYAMPSLPVPNPRPTSVTVIAILAIIFGAYGTLGGLCGLLPYCGVQFGPNPVVDAMREDAILLGFAIGGVLAAMLLGVVELLGGIASLSLKAAGRKALIGYSIGRIVLSIAVVGLELAFINGRMERAITAELAKHPMRGALGTQTVLTMTKYGRMIFSVVSLVWPILILYFISRPHVKKAFEPMGAGAE